MNKNILRDLELVLEINSLKELGMEDDEIIGYLDVFSESWELNDGQTYDN